MSRTIYTAAVHAGRPESGDPSISSVPPIDLSVSFRGTDAATLHAMLGNEQPGFSYSRYGSPTLSAFEQAMCELEGAGTARACASGMAAIHLGLLLSGLRSGDTILAAQDSYGATFAVLNTVFRNLGVTPVFVDTTDPNAVEAALAEHKPRALIVEPISNPLLRVSNIPVLADLTHQANALLIVDATFTTPFLMRTFDLGADIVIHSVSKYIGGHDDVLGGIVLARAEFAAELRSLIILTGGLMDPHAAYLALRGLRTLPLRMREHCRNAAIVADWLRAHPKVSQVYYPGFSDHPHHELASAMLRSGYGGMVAFDIADADTAAVERFMDGLKLVLPVTTLGGVASQLLYPALASHRALPPERRRALGIGDGLVRLSVGIEDPDDISADLDGALSGRS